MTFEDKIKKLEEISNKLNDEISLQEGLKLFEEGANISKECLNELNDVKGKVTIIKKNIDAFNEENFE